MIAIIKIQRRCAWSGVSNVCAWSGVWEKSKKMWKVAKSLTRVLSAHSLFRILITMLTTQQKNSNINNNSDNKDRQTKTKIRLVDLKYRIASNAFSKSVPGA